MDPNSFSFAVSRVDLKIIKSIKEFYAMFTTRASFLSILKLAASVNKKEENRKLTIKINSSQC